MSDEESGDEPTQDVEDKITLFFDIKGDEGENLKVRVCSASNLLSI